MSATEDQTATLHPSPLHTFATTKDLGRVVRKAINANLRLEVYRGFNLAR